MNRITFKPSYIARFKGINPIVTKVGVNVLPENMWISGFRYLYFVINNCIVKMSFSETHFCQVVSNSDQS